ncbi:phage tail assembly chaperone [Qipengyuania sp. JC766]|uniref:phage tail assembly chaperone n=1 Tax=Qipengyuania sp. JC766 TaxID=3232139 RepID=UPI00345A3112
MSGSPPDSAFARSAQLLATLSARALGWRPGEFWAATPAELATALAPPCDPPAMDRAALARLIESETDGR